MDDWQQDIVHAPVLFSAQGKDDVSREFVFVAKETPRAWAETPTDPRHRCRKWTIEAHLRGQEHSIEDSTYSHEFLEVDDSTVMSHEMHHNDKEHYKGKGLPEAAMQFMHERFGKHVISSSYSDATKIFAKEWLSAHGGGVWKRMERNGRARDVPGQYRWEYIPS